jgi:hypothetical protein
MMLSVIVLSVIVQSVIVLSVVMLKVVGPINYHWNLEIAHQCINSRPRYDIHKTFYDHF